MFDAVVEEIAELLHQGRQDGHLVLVLGVVELFYREFEKGILVVHTACVLVSVSSVQHHY